MPETVFSMGPYGAGLLLLAVGAGVGAAMLWGGRRRLGAGGWVVAALAFTALWAAVAVAQAVVPALDPRTVYLLEPLRTGVWLGVLVALFRAVNSDRAAVPWARDPAVWLAAGTVGLALLVRGAVVAGAVPEALAARVGMAAALVLAIVGLVLIDSLRRSGDESSRWAVKHLLIGVGVGVFGYDLYFYTEGLLLHAVDPLSAAARPYVNVLAVPFVLVSAARLQGMTPVVGVSRRVALQTTALMASGVYLLAVAAAGYLVREIGLAWGATMQIVLLAAAGLTLASLLTSGQARARFRHFIAENFFAVLFDYRREWMRFVETMENPDSGKSLYERAVRAIAQPFDCSGGALYLRGHGDRYELAANDTWGTARNLPELPEVLVGEALAAPEGYLPLDTETPSAAVAALRAQLDRPRFAVPLRHRGRALGVIVVGHARVARPLSWEARDVLGVLARQVAGYLAEEQTTRQLMTVQKFERVSRTFSYVAHDLKNVVSQLGVVVKRAEKYGDDPEFQRDAMETVAHAVESMNALLARIRDGEEGADGQGEGSAKPGRARADVTAIAADVARRRGLKTGHVTFSAKGDDHWGRADGKQLAAVLDNLVQNALDASACEGMEGRAPVNLCVRAGNDPGFVTVEVQDQGCGMTPAFVRETLFQPFASTKAEGFGLGMYQCREWVEGWGGRLEIDSVYGAGTTARVVLPASAGPDAAAGVSAATARPRAQASTTKEALAHG